MFAFFIFILSIYFFFSNKKAWSLFLLFFLTSGGFYLVGTNTNLLGISIQLADFGLLYIFFILLYKLFTNQIQRLPKEFLFINIFFIFLFISCLVDLLVNETSLGDIFRTSRNYLYLLFVYLLPSYSKEEILKAIKLLIYVTSFELFLFLLQPITGISLISAYGVMETIELSKERFGILPPFLIFAYIWFNVHEVKFKKILLFLILLAFVITATRSLLIGVVLMFLMHIFKFSNISFYKKFFTFILGLLFIFSLSFYEPVSKRFSEATNDAKNIDKDVQGNISFRFLLAKERLDYILNNTQYTVFGIGFISENNFDGKFRIGLLNDENRIIQLDTGDISWALFFLRLGLLGTFLYVLIYLSLLIYFYKNKFISYSIVGFYYIFFFMFLSIAGTIFAQGLFILIPALFYKLTTESILKGHIK